MKLVTWRNTALILGAVCGYQCWQGCARDPAPATASAADGPRAAVGPATPSTTTPTTGAAGPSHTGHRAPAREVPALPTRTFYGLRIPRWAMHFAPEPGEKLRDYRDRILPIVLAAIAPQRERVARMRDELGLDAHQRAELDGAAEEAAAAIQDEVMKAVLGGELQPAALLPMTAVATTRELLDIVERGNARFLRGLLPEQRTRLASRRFDFADYLVFSTRWEDALGAHL